ncbi:calcium-binding protein [Streptomyces sp. PmtG]
MRIRTTVAAVSGAVVLSALAVPAAQAADSQKGHTKITKVVVNGGKDIVLGTSTKQFVITVTGTDPKGIKEAMAFVWHGKKYDPEYLDGLLFPRSDPKCTKVSATKSTCKAVIKANPRHLDNATAGKWKVMAALLAKGSAQNHVIKDTYKTVGVKRAAKLTTNAAPEPVKKGETITVSGALTRANWETSSYAGYLGQPVKLQFKAAGASSYTTVKTVTSGAKGKLTSTVKASADGTFRYVFAGTSTTPAVTSAGDAIDVR